MGFLDSIEKLINEHGSAAILRERIVLLNEQHAAVVKQVVTLEGQVTELQREKKGLHVKNEQLEQQARTFEQRLFHNSNPQGYVCDHCGSPQLKRTGSRPDKTFGVLGAKEALFICDPCGKESAFTQNP